MGRLDDSFAIGDFVPTDDELFDGIDQQQEEEDEENSEQDIREASPKSRRHQRPSKKQHVYHQQAQQQQQQDQRHRHSGSSDGIIDAEPGSGRGRFIVILVLCASAAGMAWTTFTFISRNERDEFERTARAVGRDFLESTQAKLDQNLALLKSAATSTSSLAYALDEAFPFVTVPNFRTKAMEILATSTAATTTAVVSEAENDGFLKLVGLAPLVTDTPEITQAWVEYAASNQAWIQEYKQTQNSDSQGAVVPDTHNTSIASAIVTTNESTSILVTEENLFENGTPFRLPAWQMYPVSEETVKMVNVDLVTSVNQETLVQSITKQQPALTSILTNLPFLSGIPCPRCSLMVAPIPVSSSGSSSMGSDGVGALLWTLLAWDAVFMDQMSPDSQKQRLVVEVENPCGNIQLSYSIRGQESFFLGNGLLHNEELSDLASRATAFGVSNDFQKGEQVICSFTVTVYPTTTFKTEYVTDAPWVYSAAVVCVFFVAAAVFAVYDQSLHRRHEKILQAARKTSAIVAEFFPRTVQRRVIEEREMSSRGLAGNGAVGMFNGNNSNSRPNGLALKSELKNLIGGNSKESNKQQAVESYKGKPIADLFPETTIMFADIVGFTAWSSTREPSQVFTLLEGIYAAFDAIASKRRVYKVETIGDCYVAVVGLPDPRKDHAVVMAKFARDCLYRFKSLLKEMEVGLGPDTTELGIRIGMHSGPTVAGVLRGERSRFQLFGDSVNTTARMESTGYRNRIHVSQDTADLLQASGKSHWLQMRKERVTAKGKGELQTYWLATGVDDDRDLAYGMGNDVTENPSGGSHHYQDGPDITYGAHLTENAAQLSEKQMRLVEWNSEILCRKLEDIVARREAFGTIADPPSHMEQVERKQNENCFGVALQEVVEIIELPTYRATRNNQDPKPKPLNPTVTEQLFDYVQTVASMYHSNAFHNFEHASHVTMSVNKLLSRIIAPDIETDGRRDLKSMLHDHTYGITSDPLTQFAVTLSALMHDVDHSGVPNAQLVKEHTSLAAAYNNKSVAEQNSVDIAWDLLMEECYTDLRRTIYCNEVEFKRFRQLIVNTVLATDIMDKTLGEIRKARWNKAFNEQPKQEAAKDNVNRKATIVIEHLIQASDVAHTMQHWHVYRKWNARLFREMHRAYLDGRADTDPSTNWYKGELGFFDFYVIPLAKKLKNCGVFGVSSDEYLTYALQNRAEWERKGQQVVAELMESVQHSAACADDEEDVSYVPQDVIRPEPIARRMSVSVESLDFTVS